MASRARVAPGAKPVTEEVAQEQLPATTNTTALAAVNDYGEDSGAGFESNDTRDKMIPFLTILQDLSPQVKGETKVPGAEIGMLYNTVTGELWPADKGVVIQPVMKHRLWVPWIPRAKGGGFPEDHPPMESDNPVVLRLLEAVGGRPKGALPLVKNAKGEVEVEVVETVYLYAFILNDEGNEIAGPAMIAFKSTGIGPWRQWNTSMELLKGRPPIFANRARLKTTDHKNKVGQISKNWLIQPFKENWAASLISPATEAGLLAQAKDFIAQIKGGLVKVDLSGAGQGDSGGAGGASGDLPEEEAPF
jgi:hypothetical protein